MGKTGKSDTVHPHDRLVRSVLTDTDLTGDLLGNYLAPELASALDLKSLKREASDTVGPNLSELIGDLRYSGRFKGSGKELKVFLLLEHQSQTDHFMALRSIGYIHAAYKQMLPSLKKGERFPYPLTVVLHHGKSPWKHIPPMRELIDTTPGVEDDILGLPIHLIDVATMSVDNLRGHPMVCALLDSLQSASVGTLQSRMEGIFARLINLGGDRRIQLWEMALAKYYTAVRGEVQDVVGELARILTGLHGKREAEKMATTMYEQIQREGLIKGIAEGMAKGQAKGMAEGQAKSVFTVLESRFGSVPAGVHKKVMNFQDGSRIDEMLRLAVTCASLKEFQKAL